MKLITLLLMLTLFYPLMAGAVPIRNIILSGNEAFSDEQLIALMETQVEKDYDEGVLKKDFERILNFYRKNGFPFARIDEEQLRIRKFPEGVYILTIPIDEGTIKKITVIGNTRTRDSVIIRELLFEVGDIYTVEDELESERILRRKAYLGTAEVDAAWDEEILGVWLTVVVTDLWTLIPTLDVPAFSNDSSDFLVQLADSNVFGSGNFARFRYQRIDEGGEKPRSLILSRYMIPRLFESHWVFDGEYTQKRKGDSWEVRLGRPQYSLKTDWSADFRMAASFDDENRYDQGELIATAERRSQFYFGNVSRIFGDRHRQIEFSLWTSSRQKRYTEIREERGPSNAKFRDKDISMIGVSLGRREVNFIRTRFLNQMGRVEDIGVGHVYSASIGYASPLYGADRSDVSLNLLFALSQAHHDRLFLQAQTDLRLWENFSDAIWNTTLKLVRKNLFYQTFAAQISTKMELGLSGESQVILGGLNGLRGYGPRRFDGEKIVLLNLESRTIFRGGIFRRISPWIVFGSAAFVDVGYVWNGVQLDLREPRRSVGFGIRASIPKLSGSRVYRFDLAYPLDDPEKSSKPVLTYGIGHPF